MSIATTPSQIKAECSGVPTRGTIVIIATRTDCLEFIVAMDELRLIILLQNLVVKHRAWNPEIMKTIVRTTPTCPVPKNPIRELSRIVRFIPNKNSLEWTTDNWVTRKACHYDYVIGEWVYKREGNLCRE